MDYAAGVGGGGAGWIVSWLMGWLLSFDGGGFVRSEICLAGFGAIGVCRS